MSWRYKTVSKDITGWFGAKFSETEFDTWLEEMNQEGWEFVSGFAMKTQPDMSSTTDNLMVLTFRQPVQTKQFSPVMALG